MAAERSGAASISPVPEMASSSRGVSSWTIDSPKQSFSNRSSRWRSSVEHRGVARGVVADQRVGDRLVAIEELLANAPDPSRPSTPAGRRRSSVSVTLLIADVTTTT